MAIEIVKETIELPELTTDANGNCFLQKRINLSPGKVHNLLQTDIFEDAASDIDDVTARLEFAVSPYPVIPTNMPFVAGSTVFKNRFPSAGDDSILFKANATTRNSSITDDLQQFPSLQIAANQKTQFYSDHIYVCVHIMATANTTYSNFAWSFMFTVDSKNVSSLTHSMGVLAESHNAMCALVMSNGHMVSLAVLRGNTFPMWRFGGIRPEHMITPIAANAYFLPINTRDAETMTTTPGIRQAVADSRAMSAFDAPFGDRRPDWIRLHLNAGIIAGPVRDQWPPIKHADNGNVRML
tara:strand:+ start:1458 stop:2348 length:891 start_codon:yes stop_codon:yes gene_type:complete